ncbi:NB-ARC domain-containing protein [Psidium guajava]|nr:NB-ARC domain-containing protein [Psidium guajava]
MAAASDATNYTVNCEVAAEILSQKLEILLCHPELARCLLTEKLVTDAKEKLAMIQDFFSTQDRPSKSMEWLGRLLRAMYEAENFVDKFHLREARGRQGALQVVTRPAAELVSKCKLWADLYNLGNKMQELCQDQYLTGKTEKKPASSFPPANVPGQGQKKVRLTSYGNLHGSCYLWRKEEKKEIMRLEQRGEKAMDVIVNVTTILGEPGTGKTFLARWVYTEAMYQGIESHAWVRISANMEVNEFLFEILKQMGKPAREVKDMDLNEIEKMLYKELADRKEFLIVLDDVRPSKERLLRRLVGRLFYYRRGHIIITTQDKRIADSMRFDKKWLLVELGKLNADESKKMLASKLYRVPDGKCLSEKEVILKTCGGLPLSLSLLGGLLSHTEEPERQEPRLSALLKDCSGISDLLQLSYRRLPVHLKPCFIYMALFPVAAPIPTRRLVRLWLAEGLLDSHCYDRDKKLTRVPEDVGEAFILELVERNLIDVVSWRADGSPKACQMLTSLYDMIRPIAISMGFLHIHDASNSNGQQEQAQPRETKVRWLAEHTNIVRDGQGGGNPSLNLGQCHVRSFLSFYLRRGMLTKDVSTVLGNITSKTEYSLLRVLDLEGVYKPSLQGVLHKLVLLRYLGLRFTVLDSIPREVADLHYLETLDIKHTNITSLPSSLWKARYLRHLHLNWFYIDLKKILKACGNNVGALTKLQTLSGLVTGEVKENSMAGHMNCLTTLTTLKLFLQQSDKDTSAGQAVADWISCKLTNLQYLTFGVIKETKAAEEAEAKEAKLKKEAKPPKEGEQAVEAAPAEPTKVAEPEKSQIGALPELSLAQHHNLLELYLLGQLKNPIWTRLLPDSLRVLTLSGSKLKTDTIPQLGNHLRSLRTLRLLANSFLGKSMTFTADGFPSLEIMKIWKLPHLEEVNIKGGAMPHLKEVEYRHLGMLKTVEGISHCAELKTIWVIYHSDTPAFVEHLKHDLGNEMNLHVEMDTEGSGSMESDEDDSDEENEATAP